MAEQTDKDSGSRDKISAGASQAGVGAENAAAGGAIHFGRFFLSFRPNGVIGCLEFLILSLIGWAGISAAFFILLLVWGGGVVVSIAPAIAAAGADLGGVGVVFAGLFSLICGLCALIIAIAGWLYHARLLQLRLIDLGLCENFSVPGIFSHFWLCLLTVIIASVFSPLGLILFIFCSVAQGRTYRDNRDLFAPIAPVPPAAELERQMHARAE